MIFGKDTCSDLAIRSTFIVGFPGETEEDFELLLDWLSEARLSRVGCFKYENVDGARANALPGQVPEEIKAERYDRLMRHQQAISAELLGTRVGKAVEVMVDEIDEGGAVARSHWDAPEIDGNVYLHGETSLKPGDRLSVMVEAADDYDLFARRIDAEAKPAAPSYRRKPVSRQALGFSARAPSETLSSPAFAGMSRRLFDEDPDVVSATVAGVGRPDAKKRATTNKRCG
jgi:hypothetical protein